MGGNGYGSVPTFVVDDIIVKGCPYEGTIASNKVSSGVYTWEPPTPNTQTELQISSTHPCAQFQWETSTDGTNWTPIPDATNITYITPNNLTGTTHYRCKVYYSTGCPGVYQDNYFTIEFKKPEPPSGTKDPNFAEVCEGTTLTLIDIQDGSGGSFVPRRV